VLALNGCGPLPAGNPASAGIQATSIKAIVATSGPPLRPARRGTIPGQRRAGTPTDPRVR
jgi:hypothetical protein